MAYHNPVQFNPERISCMGKPEDDLHKRRHYDNGLFIAEDMR